MRSRTIWTAPRRFGTAAPSNLKAGGAARYGRSPGLPRAHGGLVHEENSNGFSKSIFSCCRRRSDRSSSSHRTEPCRGPQSGVRFGFRTDQPSCLLVCGRTRPVTSLRLRAKKLTRLGSFASIERRPWHVGVATNWLDHPRARHRLLGRPHRERGGSIPSRRHGDPDCFS